MTDRTTELKNDYEAMQNLMENFQRRQSLKVDPQPNHRWFIFEKENHDSWIEQYEPEMMEYMRFHWGNRGWTMTPVDIFRTTL